jgi:hypothetical protein
MSKNGERWANKESKERKLQDRRAAERRRGVRRMARRWGLPTVLGLLIVGGGAFVVTQAVTAKVYPPTGMQDHVESYPSCRICTEPIPEVMQRHILEHREPGNPADRPGVLVQYNCVSCPDLVAKLTRIVQRYPDAVYLAPYPRMSPRIALTTLHKLETMEEVDETRIVAFIELCMCAPDPVGDAGERDRRRGGMGAGSAREGITHLSGRSTGQRRVAALTDGHRYVAEALARARPLSSPSTTWTRLMVLPRSGLIAGARSVHWWRNSTAIPRRTRAASGTEGQDDDRLSRFDLRRADTGLFGTIVTVRER